MKKKLLALLLTFLMLVNLVPLDVFAATASGEESAAITIPACSGSPTCWGTVNGDPIHNHVDGCARKDYLKDYVTSSTAADIAAVWSGFTAEEQADILLMVQAYTGYIDELKALVDTGTTPEPELPSVSTTVTVDGVEQTVTVKGETLPEDVTLTVSNTDVTEQVIEFGIPAENLVFGVDISLKQGNNGYQPNGAIVKLPVSAPAGTKLGILHTHGDTTTLIATSYVLEDGTVEFFTDSFSEFVGFTVDFHYKGVDYSINGLTSIKLSELFTAMNIPENAFAAESVVFSDNDLVTTEQLSDGDWLLTSLQAFSTEETLVITFNDGRVIVIDVTDAESGKYDYTTDGSYTTPSGATNYITVWIEKGQLPATVTFNAYNGLIDYKYWYQDSADPDASYVSVDDTTNTMTTRVTVSSNAPIGYKYGIQNADRNNVIKSGVGIVRVYKNVTLRYLKGSATSATNMPSNKSNVRIGTWGISNNAAGTIGRTYSYTLSSTTPTATGYTFNGWKFTNWQGSAQTATAGTSVNLDADSINGNYIDFTAQWSLTPYTATFNANGGSVNPTSRDFNIETALSLPTPTRSGYRFDGWKITSAAGNWTNGTSYSASTSSIAAGKYGNVTFTAQWAPLYTVTWKNWDGTVLETDTNVPSGTTPTYNSAAPTRPADNASTYSWTGWTPAVSAISGNTTYTATYSSTPVPYTITWVDGNGKTLATETYNYGDTPTYKGAAPTKAATAQYTYTWNNGWSPAVASVTGNKTYTATFTAAPVDYTLTFNFNGSGRADSSFTVTYNSSNYYEVNWLNPVRDGHSFDGWFTQPEGGVQVYSDDGYCLECDYWDSNNRWIGSSDLTVYAHWTPLPYTVTWVDGDGKTLKTESYDYGDTPAYTGATPTKKADAQYTYTFNGTWSPAISAVTGDATYTAQFDSTINKYTVTWVNYDGSILETDTDVPYGTDPSYDGAAPTQPADGIYTYEWMGWEPTVSKVTGNVIYAASYNRLPIPYTVTWVDGDGKTLKTDTHYSNQIPSYTGATPTKKADAQYTYTFNGTWSPAIEPVTGDATYTAQFDKTVNTYTVTWVDGDGKTLGETVYEYGDTPAYTGATPTKKATDQYTYTFNGKWSPAIVDVTGDATYTAQFDSAVNEYTVTWVDGDGKTLMTEEYDYGDTPAYTGATPTKKATDQYTYTFNGTWSPAISAVTGDATYTAQFGTTVNTYTVTWVNYDGSILETDTDVPYGTDPSYDGAAPTQPADGVYTYEWMGWEPTVSKVTGNVIYAASYNRLPIPYTVTWVDGDGKTLKTDTHYSSQIPSYTGATPTKKADAQYTYTFNGTWSPAIEPVTGDATYTAQFDKTVNTYTVTWVDGDAKTLGETVYEYGDTPAYTGATPTKSPDAQYTYTFNGTWSPAIVDVTGDATYTAQFDSEVNSYTVTWVDGDGKTLMTESYDYGDTPAYTGAAPTKKADAQYTYTFNGTWSPAISAVTGDATYTAQFDSAVNEYTVTWVDGDGKTLGETVYEYGDTPAYTGATPTKKATDQYTYTFNGKWSPAIVPVTGDATYTAQFDSEVNSYTVTWVDGDGKTLKTDTHYSSQIPSYTGATPTKKADAQYTYTFNGTWSPAIEPVTGDATYTAQFDKTVNTYTVTWVDGDGKTLKTDTLEYGDTPAYTGATPTKKADAQYTYTFNGTWSPAISTVTGDATYTAQFKIATADLTIEAEGADASHSYIFTVTQIVADPAQEAITMKVVVVGNSHVTIKGLPVATYEVKEVTQWSWRQADVSAQTVLLDTGKTVSFDFGEVEKTHWLSGYSYNRAKKGGSI